MLCMICKNNVPDEAVSCPVCGAMPWQMPESFLNPEQHQVWLATVYTPQRERWDRMQQLQEENRSLQEKLRALQEENLTLRAGTREAFSSEEFVIRNGVLLRYQGAAAEVRIPDGVERIEFGAFSHCDSLEIIIIPESVTYIGENNFTVCNNLKIAYIPQHFYIKRRLRFYFPATCSILRY